MTDSPRKSPLGVMVIGVFKLVSAGLLLMLGIGIFREIGGDPGAEAEHLVALLKLDPKNQYIHTALHTISGVSHRQLYALSAGTFVYALLYAIEGIGLVLHRKWGEYFTIFMTGSLIPFETFEVLRRRTLLPGVIWALNVLIVVYLIVQLRRSRRLEKEAAVDPTHPA